MNFRFRLLPILIFCAALTVSLKLGSLWHGLDGLITSSTAAAQEKADKAKKNDPKKKAVLGQILHPALRGIMRWVGPESYAKERFHSLMVRTTVFWLLFPAMRSLVATLELR